MSHFPKPFFRKSRGFLPGFPRLLFAVVTIGVHEDGGGRVRFGR